MSVPTTYLPRAPPSSPSSPSSSSHPSALSTDTQALPPQFHRYTIRTNAPHKHTKATQTQRTTRNEDDEKPQRTIEQAERIVAQWISREHARNAINERDGHVHRETHSNTQIRDTEMNIEETIEQVIDSLGRTGEQEIQRLIHGERNARNDEQSSMDDDFVTTFWSNPPRRQERPEYENSERATHMEVDTEEIEIESGERREMHDDGNEPQMDVNRSHEGIRQSLTTSSQPGYAQDYAGQLAQNDGVAEGYRASGLTAIQRARLRRVQRHHLGGSRAISADQSLASRVRPPSRRGYYEAAEAIMQDTIFASSHTFHLISDHQTTRLSELGSYDRASVENSAYRTFGSRRLSDCPLHTQYIPPRHDVDADFTNGTPLHSSNNLNQVASLSSQNRRHTDLSLL